MIVIRAATPDDATAVATIYAPYVVTNAVSFEGEPPSADEVRSRIADAEDMYPWLIACDQPSGVVLGYARAKPFRPAAPAFRFAVEVAVYSAGDFDGKGISRQLLQTLIATLTEQNYTQAIFTVPLPNDKIIQLYEANGFQRAGHHRETTYRNGQWGDVGIWQRDLSNPDNPPEEPRAYDPGALPQPNGKQGAATPGERRAGAETEAAGERLVFDDTVPPPAKTRET